jgi:SAM-dependent methyltransferase
MRADTRLLLALNRLAPKTSLPGRIEPDAYSSWEYGEAGEYLPTVLEVGVPADASRVLDLGCGLGGKTVYLAESRAWQVTGLDLLPENVAAARKFAVRRGAPEIDFLVGDAAALPHPAATFDLVVTSDTFEHFDRPREVLSEIVRVLRPGGLFAALFGPYASPYGGHLTQSLSVPWCHLLFPKPALFEAVHEIARRRAEDRGVDRAEEEENAREEVAFFERGLNRMSLRRFRRLVAEEPELRVRLWTKRTPGKLRILAPLVSLPGADELLTQYLIMVAEKRPAPRSIHPAG